MKKSTKKTKVTVPNSTPPASSTKARDASSGAKPTSPQITPAPATVPVARPEAKQSSSVALTVQVPRARQEAPAAAAPMPPSLPHSNRVSLELVNPEAKHVFVAGSFNGWKPDATPLIPAGDGHWVGNLEIQPGRHEYLFVIDGQWTPDPKARETVQNPFGGQNSVLIVSE